VGNSAIPGVGISFNCPPVLSREERGRRQEGKKEKSMYA